MRCPKCQQDNDTVIDSTERDEGTRIYRRRKCLNCGKRWSTRETIAPWDTLISAETPEPLSGHACG